MSICRWGKNCDVYIYRAINGKLVTHINYHDFLPTYFEDNSYAELHARLIFLKENNVLVPADVFKHIEMLKERENLRLSTDIWG